MQNSNKLSDDIFESSFVTTINMVGRPPKHNDLDVHPRVTLPADNFCQNSYSYAHVLVKLHKQMQW